MERLLHSAYPAVHRMACGLSGSEDSGRGIVRFMMSQSLKRMPQWRDAEAAERWFYHHTVLTGRRALLQPGPDALLVRNARPEYVAFLRALRGLPQQQCEAFILHHGEKLSPRSMGIAMDCSTHAAEVHLRAAHDALEPMMGDAFPALTARMAQAYSELTPSEDLVRPAVRSYVTASLWPRRIKRVVTAIMVLIILALIAWIGLQYRKLLGS